MADTGKLTSANTTSIKLDWSRLLGFDQAAQSADEAGASQFNDPRLAKLGAKAGAKPAPLPLNDPRLGAKAGPKLSQGR